MSILSPHAVDCFTLFKRSLIQSDELPLADVLSDQLFKDVFEEERVEFGIADGDVFTPAITLWAMVSQFLFSDAGRSVKAAAGRVASLYAHVAGRVIKQNAGNYCRAKAKIPANWIGSLYQGRWIIEPDIESIKCTMGIEHLRGQSPEAIERELWTGLLTYNLVRSKMLQVAYSFQREVRSLSFTETYQVLSTNWLLCACVGVSTPMASASLGQSVCAVVGNRPGRVEPRENKRRPKVLKLMTVARRIFHAARAALTKIP